MIRTVVAVAAVATAALLTTATTVSASPDVAPRVTVDRTSVHPGDHLLVKLDGFDAPVVTVAVCGNLARRGSGDCDMVGSQAVSRSVNSPDLLLDLVVGVPPVPCPCVVRASDPSQDQVAYASFELLNFPTAPIVEPQGGDLLDVSVAARRASADFLASARSALGGGAVYDVVVTVRNRSGEQLHEVRLTGAARRNRGRATTTFRIPHPGQLDPDETWSRQVRVSLPAPVLGRVQWFVRASGAGPVVGASTTSGATPTALVLVLVLLVVDVGAMVARRRRSAAAKREREASLGATGREDVVVAR